MAAPGNSRTSSTATPVAFSYAQAAKGHSATSGSSTSKASSSGAVTPAKDSQPVVPSAAAVMSWAEDTETNGQRSEKLSDTPALASPEIGASTASTVTKDDDVSSVPNTSSDSTWENKSQASNSVDKSIEPSEKTSQKGKGKKREQQPAKPLQEAPLPTVNIWQQRAELWQKPGRPAVTGPVSSGTAPKQDKDANSADVKSGAISTEAKSFSVEEKSEATRQQSKTETDVKKSTKSRPQEKESKEVPTVFRLPPDRDQESWPTMDAAIDEDRKKAQEKTDKSDKERKGSVGAKAGGKGQWVKVPFVPSVNFSTPLPSTGARRGGRSTARGGAQSSGRFNTNGPEKDTSSPGALPTGDQSRRGRPDASARETSPKAKRNTSAGSLAAKEKPIQSNGDKSAKSAQGDIDAQPRGNGVLTEAQNNASGPGQHNTFPRPYSSNRPNKGRRADWSVPDRKKDSESSLPKENGVTNDRSSSTQTDAPEESERRAPNHADGQSSHQSKRGSSERYGGYNGRERRGGARGNRGGNFSSGHQFTNGHMSIKQQSAYPGPMSPTAFNPEQTPYFPQPRFRNPRSQSVNGDSMYRMSNQYGGPQQMTPVNTYLSGNGFDFPMMQHPMSAVPFNQYGVDQFALFSMVTTQLEYYFSLDNLCKDMFLRKHMDSKGFVFLNFISDFNRVKHLTADVELIKLVCYQSRIIEFRIGHDGKDRLRARENWQQWVLPIEERDPSAQNEGPEELYNPPIPHPYGFDPNGNPRYPDMTGALPSMPDALGNEGLNPTMKGFQPGASQHAPVASSEGMTNGATQELVNGDGLSNGNAIGNSADV